MNDILRSLESIQVCGPSDLQAFGINPLTGEACAFSMRLLCDVNEAGKTLLQEYWGVPTLLLAAPMNSQVDDLPSIGSVMLARSCWRDLAAFAAFRKGAVGYVQREDGTLVALFSDSLLERYVQIGADVVRNPAPTSPAPRVGTRNVHQMTGRVL